MNLRRKATLLCMLLCGALAARAEERPLAAHFPADTFLYMEADAGAVERGARQLDLAKMLADPRLRDFLRPTLQRINADVEQPIDALLAMVPMRQWCSGGVAIGLRGLILTTKNPDGTETRTRISPDSPITLRMLAQIGGGATGQDGGAMSVIPDLLLVVDTGPALRDYLNGMLSAMPWPRTDVDVKGRRLTQFVMPATEMFGGAIFADMSGDRWVVGTDAETVAEAPRGSLAASESFLKLRNRMTSGERVLFGYADLAAGSGAMRNFIAPILTEAFELSGIGSLRGLGFGLSMTEGGVRESLGLLFNGKPTGMLRALDAMPGGFAALDIAGDNAAGFFGIKFDASILYDRIREFASILPGGDRKFEGMVAQGFRAMGLDFASEVKPALGDEVSFILYPPPGFIPVPDWTMLANTRDPAAFAKLLDKAKAMVSEMQLPLQIQPLALEGGDPGFLVMTGFPILPPAFAIRNGWLIGASHQDMLRKAIANWKAENVRTLKSGEVFQQTVRGLGGGIERFSLLAYMDLRTLVPQALAQAMSFAPRGWVDETKMPDLKIIGDHMHGIAFGIRHDDEGLSIEAFSPVGMIGPMMIAGIAMPGPRRMREGRPPKAPEPEPAPRSTDDDAVLGIESITADGSPGILIGGLYAKGPAALAGMQKGDRIVSYDGQPIASLEELLEKLAAGRAGDQVAVGVERDGQMVGLVVTLVRRADLQRE